MLWGGVKAFPYLQSGALFLVPYCAARYRFIFVPAGEIFPTPVRMRVVFPEAPMQLPQNFSAVFIPPLDAVSRFGSENLIWAN